MISRIQRPRPSRGRNCRLALILPLLALVIAAVQAGAAFADTINLMQQSVRDRPAIHRSSYNYAPAIIHDGSLFHLYWCGGVAGDFILHARSASLGGPWRGASNINPSNFDVALQPTASHADFDGQHTCDPNVLKIRSRYYLYYSGSSGAGALTAIGVAESADAVHFVRLNGGRPIITAAQTNPNYAAANLTYGAGQPAATYVAPYIYLSFTDSTGAGVNKGNGAGQFALRSTDPTFSTGLQELTAAGWQPRKAGQHTAEYAYLESFGLDWAYDANSRTIVAASDLTSQKTSVFALDPQTLHTRGTATLDLNWREGPGLVAEADKSMAPRAGCDQLPLTVFAAEGASDSPWSWNTFSYSTGVFSFRSLCH